MNIPKISLSSPNFGQVKGPAAERAILTHRNNRRQLERVYNAIQEQKFNTFDVISAGQNGYAVNDPVGKFYSYRENFFSACQEATRLRIERENEQNPQAKISDLTDEELISKIREACD